MELQTIKTDVLILGSGGAGLFGESAAVAALEEGEDHGLKNYKDEMKQLSTGARGMALPASPPSAAGFWPS